MDMGRKSKSKNVGVKKCIRCNENMKSTYITCPRCGYVVESE